jgi:hypothetical protein
MPVVVPTNILVDDDDPGRATDKIGHVLGLAMMLLSNGILDWSFPVNAVPVEVSSYQLEEKPAGYLADFVKAGTRH